MVYSDLSAYTRANTSEHTEREQRIYNITTRSTSQRAATTTGLHSIKLVWWEIKKGKNV